MFRYIVFIGFFTIVIFSKNIHFLEEKYYSALDSTFQKRGNIHFSKDEIEIVYEEDKTRLTVKGDILMTQKGKNKKELDLNKKPVIKMFFILFEAIYFEKKDILQSYFHMTNKEGISTLIPKKDIAQYIKSVRYYKTTKKLNFLQINLKNSDRIRIEEIR